MKLGLIGYGNVGKAFVRMINERFPDWEFVFILKSDGGLIDANGINLENVLPYENDLSLSPEFCQDLDWKEALATKPDYLVELSHTNISDAQPATTYIKTALSMGISVATGNKGPIALHYRELKKLADENKASLGIGCTVGGALPSVIVGKEAIAGAKILSIQGVLTGTTNYILNEMRSGSSFDEVLDQAQRDGIAEKDPSMDVDGYDTAIKMLIITNYLMGTSLTLADVQRRGIREVTPEEVKAAKDQGKKIKLVGRTCIENEAVMIKVQPEIVEIDSMLYNIEGKNKGIWYQTDILGDVTVIGGASAPQNAAASVLRDICNDIERGKL